MAYHKSFHSRGRYRPGRPARPVVRRQRPKRLGLQKLSLLGALALLAGWSAPGAAQDPPGQPVVQDPQAPQSPLVFSIDDEGIITFAVDENEGLPITDFIKLAYQVTGKNFTFNPAELQTTTNPTVAWMGSKKLRSDEFFAFFQTMLYIRGFAIIPRGRDNTEVIEVVNLAGPKRNEIASAAIYVEEDNLEDYASQTGVTILTTVELAHVNAPQATNALRPFFAQTGGAAGGQGVLIGNVGNPHFIVLQGFGPQVNAASKLLKLVDRPQDEPELQIQVVPL